MVTVRELIGELQWCDPNAEVLLSRDGDGTRFQLLHRLDLGTLRDFWGESVFSGTNAGGQPAVCLWPKD